MVLSIPFGSPAALVARNASLVRATPTQDIAIVVCGGGDPLAEYNEVVSRCVINELPYRTFCGNDMIAEFPHQIDVAGTLHPDKLHLWLTKRTSYDRDAPKMIYAHRPFNNVTHWTRDWQGSTGLFLVKIAREMGHTHIVLCGVPMTVEANHFVRHEPWKACHGFRRGWTSHVVELKNYVRSYSGWTQELFGAPTDEWLIQPIDDQHRQIIKAGEKA